MYFVIQAADDHAHIYTTYNYNTLYCINIIRNTALPFFRYYIPLLAIPSLHFHVDVSSPRHSARPFHHTRSSIARLLPPHPPITQAPAALPPAVRATSFALSSVPSSLLLSSSPAPLSAAPAQHSMLYYPLYSVVYYTARACPQRPEGAPTTSPKRRRSPLESK